MRKKPLLCLNIYLWALFLVPIGLTIPLANLSTFSFLQYLFHFIVLSLNLMIKVNLHPNIFKIYDPLSQKHPDSRTCSVAKEQEWWHILWEYGSTLDLCQEITEGTVSIVVTGSVFTGLAKTCWLILSDVGRYQSLVASLLVMDSKLFVGAAAGGSFLCSLGITMLLLHAQQRQKRAKDWHQWDRDWAPCYSCWLLFVFMFLMYTRIPH